MGSLREEAEERIGSASNVRQSMRHVIAHDRSLREAEKRIGSASNVRQPMRHVKAQWNLERE
jgi:hypothetical protein